ncbi:hypothetical protein TNCV_325051 [Trichonephila clavipes]|nr:hypothetical protein TNCV_325051 [Trichonephila clavipes]
MGDGHHNFESWLSEVTRTTPELASLSRNFHTTPMADRLNVYQHSLHATRGVLVTVHVILNHGQVTWTTLELALTSPNYRTTPMGGQI